MRLHNSATPVPPSDARTDARCGSFRPLLFVHTAQRESGGCACPCSVRAVRLEGAGRQRLHSGSGALHHDIVNAIRPLSRSVHDRTRQQATAAASVWQDAAVQTGPRTCLFTGIRTLSGQSTDREGGTVRPRAWMRSILGDIRGYGESERPSAGGSSESEAPSSESVHLKAIPGRAHEYQMMQSMGGLTAARTVYVYASVGRDVDDCPQPELSRRAFHIRSHAMAASAPQN